MKSFGIIAASALFGALINAAPVIKRNMVYVTETDIDVITIPVTTTVWIDGGATSTKSTAPTTTLQADFFQPSLYPPVSSTTVAPVETSSSASSSVFIIPTTSSTSVYVASTISSSTSIYVAPTTSSSSTIAVPTTTAVPTAISDASATTSSSATAATSSASSVAGLAAAGTSYTGDMTWYEVGLGSCGLTSVETDTIVAISHIIMDAYNTGNPNDNPLCGRSVTITGVSGDKYTAQVVDRCVGCAEGDLDLAEDFFNTVTDNGNGRVHDITWVWD